MSGWRHATDTAAAGLVFASLAKVLPVIAALVGLAYYLISIWDSGVGQRWRRRWRGVAYYVTGATDMAGVSLQDIERKLEDLRMARDDYVLIALTLGLGGAGIGIALLVLFVGAFG